MKNIARDTEVAIKFSDKPRLGSTVATYLYACPEGNHMVRLTEPYGDFGDGEQVVVNDDEITVD